VQQEKRWQLGRSITEIKWLHGDVFDTHCDVLGIGKGHRGIESHMTSGSVHEQQD